MAPKEHQTPRPPLLPAAGRAWRESELLSQMDSFRPVDPVRPAAPYVGGKRFLADRLVARIDATPHKIYAEPFVGMGGVFFRRRNAPRSEVINDASGDVATFFRILQRHYVAFLEMLRYQLTSRREFERLKATAPTTLTDLERAARFLYLQRTAYGGKVVGRTFGIDPTTGGAFNVTRIVPILEAIHERLAGVTIECLPWSAFLDRYDRSETLFYLDPPYWGAEHHYGEGLFGPPDFTALATRLKRLQGRFILSINDVPEVRALFAWAAIDTVQTSYGLASGQTKVGELIIRSGTKGRK